MNSEAMESLTKPFVAEENTRDPYLLSLNDMSMEIRARPSERTKTPEEIAQKEREKLEALEEERKKRMQETEELSDGDEEIGGEESTKRLTVISGDDLGDSFSVEEDKPKRGWIDDVLEREDNVDNSESDEDEDSESEEEEDDDGESDGGDEKQRKGHHLEDWEQSDDELGAELEDEEEDDDEEDDDEEDDEIRVHKK